MPLTEEQRRTLLARSTSLRERLACSYGAPSPPLEEAAIAARRARWCQVTTKGNPASFERLLKSRNIEPICVDKLLDAPQWRDDMPLPGWLNVIDSVIAAANNPDPFELHGLQPEISEQPTGIFLAPFCAVARKRLELSLPDNALKISATVFRALTDNLAHGIHFVCKEALDAHWELYLINHGATRAANADGSLVYAFWSGLRQPERLAEFLIEYSVAARASATLMDYWHCNTLELMRRLTADTAAIELVFLNGAPLRALVTIECGLSDPHNGGKSVMRLHFASGLRLIYKPRSVAIDLAYNALLEWLTQNGAPYPLRRPSYLARECYAWIEQIDHETCQSPQELSQFCHTMGALLCISYLLDATDLHDGNVIATHTSPVVVDLETLLQPRLAETQSCDLQDALRKAAALADRSILRTGLLPSLKLGADGQVADVGCMGSLFTPHSTEWYSHNPSASPYSDAMRHDAASGELDTMVLADGVAEGFKQTYRFLQGRRHALMAPTGPLVRFDGLPVRFLLRDTSVYIRLLAPSLSAQSLREGVDRSIALESLYRLVQNRPASEAFGAMIEQEITALEALDIPLLSTTTSIRTLRMKRGESGPDIFSQPSQHAMLARLQGYNEQDMNQQLDLLYGAFAARSASSRTGAPPIASVRNVDSTTGRTNPLTTASAIAAELRRRAIVGDDGSVTWMAPVSIPNTSFFRFDMVPLGKESGIIGIALFLAAYSRTSGDTTIGSLALQAVQTVTQRLGIATASVDSADPVPTIAGLGSMLYAIHRIGTFLGDSHTAAAANRLVERMPNQTGAGASLPGSLADCSEFCLGLIAMDRQDLAAQWGQLLMEHWSRLDSGRKSTVVLNAPQLALCWFRLHEITQASRFQAACKETLQTMCRISEQGTTHQIAFDFALLGCHGGLSGAALGTEILRTKLEALRHAQPAYSDNLQAGGCSAMERLFEGAHSMNRPELLGSARHALDDMTQRATLMGGFQTIPGMPRATFFPGFDQGLCGIGYTLLRHTSAVSLPCVQLWK